MWQTILNDKIFHWALMVILLVVSPFVYANIQGYWALLLVPVINMLSVREAIPMAATMILMNFIGSIIVALLLSLPLGYVTKYKYFRFSVLLSLGLLSWLLWVHLNIGLPDTALILAVRTGEFITLVIAVIVMAKIGAHLRVRHDSQDT